MTEVPLGVLEGEVGGGGGNMSRKGPLDALVVQACIMGEVTVQNFPPGLLYA